MNADVFAVYAAKEDSEGVAQILTSADAVPTIGADIQIYEGDMKKSEQDKPMKGANTEVNSDPHNTIKFGVEVIASGVAAQPSKQSDLMLSCGWNRVIDPTADAEKIIHSLISGNGDSQTLAHKQLQENDKEMTFLTTGCRGSMSGKVVNGEKPKYDFDFKGKYHTPTEENIIIRDPSAWKQALPSSTENTLIADLDGFAVCFEQFNWNQGQGVNRPKVVGCPSTQLGNRSLTGNIIVKAYDLSVKNYFTKMESHNGITTLPLNMVHGTEQYSILDFLLNIIQLGKIKRAKIDDMLAWDISWTAISTDANPSEMIITEK